MGTDREPRGFTTRAIHGVGTPSIDQVPASVPIYQTSTYRFDSSEDYAETIAFRREGYTYTRGYGNPTLEAFEARMADLEGTEAAMSFASGMAAIHTVLAAHAGAGETVVAARQLYGGTYDLLANVLPRFGVRVRFVDPNDPDEVAAALPGASLFYCETVANPAVAVADLEVLGRLCREAGVPAAVDNTFASPYLCTPAAYGFGFVIHSVTKYVGGHHDLVGGVVCSDRAGRALLRDLVIDTGGTMAPFEAWLCIRSLATLALRMDRHCATASFLAERLASHPAVEAVRYPALPGDVSYEVARRVLPRGAGGVFGLEVRGGVEGGAAFCDALELGWVATSLGGTHTLVGHAASTTHRQLPPEERRAAGIAEGLVRVSVGLEDAEDLLADMTAALEAV
jgi:methionine-gamma-lyase